MVLIFVITTSVKVGRSTEVRGPPLLGFPFITGVGTTTFTVFGQAIVISGKGAQFFLSECQCVLSNAKFMMQLTKGSLSLFQLITQTSNLGLLIATVG